MVTNAELRESVRRVEAFIGITDERMDDPMLVDLLTQIITLRLDAENTKSEINGYRNDIDERMAEDLNFREATTLQLEGLHKENENLRAEVVVLCRAVAALGSTRGESSKVKIPEPKAFSGARSAKELKNSSGIWNNDVSAGRPRIDTWTKLMKEMRDQFLPSNVLWLARDKLKRLRQNGSARDYIKEFTSVMLDIQNMSDEDKLHNFISGAIAAADSLMDFRTTRPIADVPSTSKPKKKGEKKGDWKRENRKDYANDKGKAPMKEGNKENRPKNKDGSSKGCWTCGGPHLAKSCPNRERVNPLLAGNLNQNEEEEEVVTATVNPLGLSFNHITLVNNVEGISKTSNPHASLIHIEMKIKEKCVIAMADTGATHTFIDVYVAAKLGLKLTKSPSYVKTVNAKSQAIVGMAYGVSMLTENWVGKHNLMVMPLGDFEIILGIDFLRKYQFVPFRHLDGMMIMNEDNAGFVKGVYPYGKVNKVAKKKDKGMLLSAMSIDKGLKKGDETILAALIELKPDVKWMGQVQDGTMRRYWIEDDLLHFKGGRIVVPNGGGLRKDLMKKAHDTTWVGHSGVERMLALLSHVYFGPKMEGDIEAYVKTCHVCQVDKTERKKEAGLLQPLPIPKRPWLSPMTPLDVAKTKNQEKCPATYRVARDRLEMFSEAQDNLRKSQRRMKKYADQHRRSIEFNVGDKVLLKLTPQIWKQIVSKTRHRDAEDPNRSKSKSAPPSIPTQFDAEIEKILDHRVVGTSKKNTKTEFLIHWKGKSAADAVWERSKDFWQFDDQIKDYLKTVSMRTSSSSGAGELVNGKEFKTLGCWQGSLNVQGLRVGKVVGKTRRYVGLARQGCGLDVGKTEVEIKLSVGSMLK
ncbi:hypothetical protein KY290_006553 [Solanum tuberosum]|uniref:Chromo domain-containing protein n=1 Tax=Solanum tuberosum TaxID=4113 RepID=A0ABQ7WH93_SOLTU|nr:hypothetical protein KY285_005113 [Solanum tuberosum]KAH0780126.1 hypothetical protein KY290_006553 [Solanum tuberosum]